MAMVDDEEERVKYDGHRILSHSVKHEDLI